MEPQESTSGGKNTIPIAIVIAGLLIAGAVVYTNRGDGGNSNTPRTETSGAAIEINAITSEDHILGNPNAEFVVVEYSDTECPFCKNLHDTLHQVIDTYGRDGEVAWVYRHFPIESLHARAPLEAEATECAAEIGGNTGFWSYIDRLYEITPSNDGLSPSQLPNIAEEVGLNRANFEACLESGRYEEKVAEHFEDAQRAGGRGTPFNVIVAKDEFNQNVFDLVASAQVQLPPGTLTISDDGKRMAVSGALPYSFWELIFDVALGKTNSTSI